MAVDEVGNRFFMRSESTTLTFGLVTAKSSINIQPRVNCGHMRGIDVRTQVYVLLSELPPECIIIYR